MKYFLRQQHGGRYYIYPVNYLHSPAWVTATPHRHWANAESGLTLIFQGHRQVPKVAKHCLITGVGSHSLLQEVIYCCTKTSAFQRYIQPLTMCSEDSLSLNLQILTV